MPDGLNLLSGIRVVSIEQFISAPYCTSILADAGATVIKVERPPGGDPRRGYQPVRGTPGNQVSGGFASYNRGKRSIALDFQDEAGRERLLRLLATADVLVCNLKPGSLDRAGLAAATLRREYPRLVYCEISGFGVTGGPYAGWPAFDSVVQGMSGLASLIGEDGGPPGLAPMGTMDLLTGIYAAVGILAALVRRAATGVGAHVDASMYDIGAAFLERPLTLLEFTGQPPARSVDRFSPVGVFRAGDGGWVSIVIPTDEMWRRCCAALGRPDMEKAPELSTVQRRAERMRDVIIPAFESWAAAMTRQEAAARLQAAGQPAGIVQDIAEVRRCPHLAYRGLFRPLAGDPGSGSGEPPVSLPRLPLLIDGAGARPGPVPGLGEYDGQR